MAENLQVTPGTGAAIAMDLITDPTLGTALVGYGKIMDGVVGGTIAMRVTATGAAKVDGSWYTQTVSGNVGLVGNTTLTAFQGGSPWGVNASIIGTPGVNASIQGTANVAFASGSTVTAIQGTNPWLSNASIVGTPSVNVAQIGGTNSVSGGVAGTVAVGGNQAAGVTLAMGLNPVISAGEDYAANPKIQIPKIDSSGTAYANVSLQGTPGVNASIQGTVPVSGFPTSINVSLLAPATITLAGNVSIGSISVSTAPTITALQGNAPWTVVASLANNATVTAFQGAAPWTANVSVIGTVPVSGFPTSVNVSLLAPATVTLSGFANVQGNQAAGVTLGMGGNPVIIAGEDYAGNPKIQIPKIDANGSMYGNVTVANIVTVAGSFSTTIAAGSTVAAEQIGVWAVNVSLLGNATLTAFQGGAPWTVNASIQGTVPVSGFPTAVNVSLLAPALVTLSPINVSLAGITSVNVSLLAPALVTLGGVLSAPGDALSNTQSEIPTAGLNYLYNGASWDRWQGNISLGARTQGAWAQQANASVQWTSATASGASLGLNTTGYGTWFVTFTGVSMTAGTVNFEAYDGAQWWPLPLSRVNSYGIDTSFSLTPQTGNSQAWQGDIAGWQQVRLRLNPAITGAAGNAYFQMTANGADNITQIVAGATLLGNVSIGGPIAATQSGTWNVTASLANNATVTAFQGASPWLVNASVIGAHNVSVAGNVTLGPVTATLAGGVNLSPLTGGWSSYATSALASTVTISAAAGKVGGYFLMNTNTAPAYLQVFDAVGAGGVSLGLNYSMIFPFPANPTSSNGLAANLELANGANIANGIKAAVTTGINASIVATGLVGTFWYH